MLHSPESGPVVGEYLAVNFNYVDEIRRRKMFCLICEWCNLCPVSILADLMLRAVLGLSEPGVGSGQLRSSDGRGFSERVAAPTCLSRPGFQSRTEGSSRGATAGKAARRETTSAEWAVLHGDDI